MSKSIYEEVIELKLKAQVQFFTFIKRIRELESKLIKQVKLLSQIKEIIDREEDLSFSSMLEESISYHEIKKLIKELENE